MSISALYADPELAAYRSGQQPLPESYFLWPLYGAGFENLGLHGQPIQVPLREPGPDEILVRHDAVGLCFSDTKVIHAGPDHPRLTGRDMRREPVVVGHEVVLTVMRVGENRREQFRPGDRFIVQADIYYQGKGLAYGYVLQGGLSQYNVIGKEVLDGDEGCYLLPVKPETGYAQAALTEPWACVTASYDVEYRTAWQPHGKVLIVAGPAADPGTRLGAPYAEDQPPALVVTLGVQGALEDELQRKSAAQGFRLVTLEAPCVRTLESAKEVAGDQGFDDIIVLGGNGDIYGAIEPLAAKGCLVNLVGWAAQNQPARVDVGRLHYDHLALTGTRQPLISEGYKPINADLRPGGAALFIGAAGPMGQMHVQRALQAQDGLHLIVATDLDPGRLAVLETKYASLIEAKRGRAEFVARVQGDLSPEDFNASLVELTGGRGFDNIVVLAPSARVIEGAVPMLAEAGVMNIFAGLTRGTRARVDLSAVVEKGVRFTGTSGSSIHDLRRMLSAAESGTLDPNLSVAAVGGLFAAKEGLEGVDQQRYPGKVVIYPQVLQFPITPLEDLKGVLPAVYAKLGPQHSWTVQAEAQFLKELLP